MFLNHMYMITHLHSYNSCYIYNICYIYIILYCNCLAFQTTQFVGIQGLGFIAGQANIECTPQKCIFCSRRIKDKRKPKQFSYLCD